MVYPQAFDIVNLEKDRAAAAYNLLRKIAGARQILELVALLGLISWSTARVPAAATTAAAHAAWISAHLFNHRVAFLIGNAIVVLLFLHFRRSDAAAAGLYDGYIGHSEAAEHRGEPPPPPAREEPGGAEGTVRRPPPPPQSDDVAVEMPPSDDVAEVIERAVKQIKRFERTQSEKLRREIGVRPQAVLRRSESENRRTAGDMERLSNEEFRQTVDDFIDKHWSKKTTMFEKYQLAAI
ncbi:deformed epidermal autoregulatory factor 1 homolog [Striga asiatica]|uniref:Deformed epidermal autoregulatory factor 1 homolog n=1 Tax=Striga asiatica TaxID=4170 RepID=A0A5A7PRG7_STRAF|nr:deformed epidermal autoregulatory factor 1 homolog [Striga asiatica]